jgi:lysophospholipase L1-like esterase
MRLRLPLGPAALALACTLPAAASRPTPDESASKWESAIAAFEAADRATPPPSRPVLFTGSSSIRLWDLAAAWPDRPDYLNRGFGGSTLADCLHFFPRLVTRYRPRGIVLYAGDNDLSKGMTVEALAADFAAFAARVEAELPGTPILYVAVKPSRKRWALRPVQAEANRIIAAMCAASPRLAYADVATPLLPSGERLPAADWFVADGLHLSEKGYAVWKATLQPWLDRLPAP